MFKGVFNFPDAEVMMERLADVYDTDRLRTNFYAEFTKHAGTQSTPKSVVQMIELALRNYLRGMSPEEVLLMHRPSLIEAWISALIPNETLAAEAKSLWAEAP